MSKSDSRRAFMDVLETLDNLLPTSTEVHRSDIRSQHSLVNDPAGQLRSHIGLRLRSMASLKNQVCLSFSIF